MLSPGSTSIELDLMMALLTLGFRYIGDLEQKIKEFQSQLAEPRNVESRQRESTNPAPLATGTADTANNSEVNDSSRAKDLRRQHHAHSPSFIEGGGIR